LEKCDKEKKAEAITKVLSSLSLGGEVKSKQKARFEKTRKDRKKRLGEKRKNSEWKQGSAAGLNGETKRHHRKNVQVR